MSRGKYSPSLPNRNEDCFTFNCYKQDPAPWTLELKQAGSTYDEKTMFGNYDDEGFDRYGYSAFYSDGSYAGLGSGIDRLGNTESDYMNMSDEDFDWL
jgi:hypothetical protein